METVKVRWAIIGTGGIARRTVGDLQLTDNADLAGICSRDLVKAQRFATDHSIPLAFGDFDELCASGEVDAVYVGIPHGLHFDYAARALRRGIHVVCEKPLTMTSAEAQELQSLSVQNNAFLMEAMWMKFTPAMLKLGELLESGVIGRPRLLQAGAGFPVPADGPQRYWVAELGGGALYDLGVYTITLAHLVLGVPDHVIATGEIRDDGVDLQEAYTLVYDSGAFAQLTNSMVALVPPAGWIGGTKGSIILGEPIFAPRSIRVVTGQPPAPPEVEELTFEQEGAGYVPMFRAASDAIHRGELEHPVHTVANTVAVLQTMELVRDQLRQAQPSGSRPARTAAADGPRRNA